MSLESFPPIIQIGYLEDRMIEWQPIVVCHVHELVEPGDLLAGDRIPQGLCFKLPIFRPKSGGQGRSQPSWKFSPFVICLLIR